MSQRYLGQRSVTLEVLPTRVAYLVRADSSDDFRRAVSEATSRWAGQSEPILGVSPTGLLQARDRQIAHTLNLDAAVNIGIGDDDVAARAALALGLLRWLGLLGRLWRAAGDRSAAAHAKGALHLIPAIGTLSHEFEHRKGNANSVYRDYQEIENKVRRFRKRSER